jgi:NnrS protein/Domain of Unknown function (DUF542)
VFASRDLPFLDPLFNPLFLASDMTAVMPRGVPTPASLGWEKNPMIRESFDPSAPVRDLLARFPEIQPVLAAHGLDGCCGGEHPLSEACRARHVPLEDLLGEIERARSASIPEVSPTMSIRELRKRFPSTISVLERYGLAECGGDDGPDEPVGWFATMHRLPLEEVLREVRAAAAGDTAAERSSGTRPVPRLPKGPALAFDPRFILGSLFLTLTLGATTGMINLLRIAAGADVPLSHRQIHGHTQILGFATLFLMGIAYHALPRILGIGSTPQKKARAAFWLMFFGVILRNIGQPLGIYAAGRATSLLSVAFETAAGALFCAFVFARLREAPVGKYRRSDPFHLFLFAGTVYLAIALALNATQGVWLAGHLETAIPVNLAEAFTTASLYGFLLAWIYGFGHRMVALFLGVGPASGKTPQIALAAQAGGLAAALFSYLPGLPVVVLSLWRDVGLGLLAFSAAVYLAGSGLVWRRVTLPMLPVRGRPELAIRAAFGCLGLWSLLTLAGVALSRWTPLPAENPWWNDAARHVFTIGFLTLLIVGMSLRILPVFSGRSLWSARLAYATYGLVLLGVAMRLLQYPAAFAPWLYRVGSWMGIPVVLALVFFTLNLVRTMKSPQPRTRTMLPLLGATGK